MGKPSDHPKFRALKRQWDVILMEVGFEDLEDERGQLKQRASNAYRGAHQVVREAKLEFYMQVAQRVAHTQFPNPRDRFIMECFAEGIKQVDINRMLFKCGRGMHRISLWKVIRKWLVRWNLKRVRASSSFGAKKRASNRIAA